jgi:predicted Zn-dependent protease
MSNQSGAAVEQTLKAALDEAHAASAARDWPHAAALWDELREQRPGDPHCWFRAGEAYSEAGMLDTAEYILAEAVERFPEHRWIAYCHTRVSGRSGDWLEALKRAEKLRQAAPDFWQAWVEEGEALVRLGRRSEAEQLLREAASRFPDEYWPHYVLARVEAAESGAQGAIRIWSALAKRFPDQPSATAALQAATAAKDQPGAALPAGQTADPGVRRLTERLFQRSRHGTGGRSS